MAARWTLQVSDDETDDPRLDQASNGHYPVEVSTRTLQGRCLLRPDPRFNRLVLGVLGRALQRFPVRLHAYAFLSNHYHLILTPEDTGQLSGFMGYFNGNLAREAARYHGWRGRVWARRYHSSVISLEGDAQVSRLIYLLSQGCKEDLVASPVDWPGVTCIESLRTGEAATGLWIDRSTLYEACRWSAGSETDEDDHAVEVPVPLDPLPCWSDLRRERIRDLVDGLIEDIVERCAAHRRAAGKTILGCEAILTQNPHRPPVDRDRLASGPAPRVLAATRPVRKLLTQIHRSFLVRHREASEEFMAGRLTRPFPSGSFRPVTVERRQWAEVELRRAMKRTYGPANAPRTKPPPKRQPNRGGSGFRARTASESAADRPRASGRRPP